MADKESGIIRKPIIRKAIKLPLRVISYYKRESILNEMMEDSVWDIVEKYEQMFREHTGSPHYLAVPRTHGKYEDSKSFQKFQEVYYICRLKEWDAMFYIECQFQRVKRMDGKFRAPMINMLASDGAIAYAMKNIGSVKLKYEKDMKVKSRLMASKADGTYIENLEMYIMKSVLDLQKALKDYKTGSTPENKALELYNRWRQYSPEYIYSIPWLRQVVSSLPRDETVERYILTFEGLSTDPYLHSYCLTACDEIEKYYNIPTNVNL